MKKLDNFIKKNKIVMIQHLNGYHIIDQFNEIKRKDDSAITIRKNDPLKLNMDSKRKSDKKVILKYSYSLLQSITNEV